MGHAAHSRELKCTAECAVHGCTITLRTHSPALQDIAVLERDGGGTVQLGLVEGRGGGSGAARRAWMTHAVTAGVIADAHIRNFATLCRVSTVTSSDSRIHLHVAVERIGDGQLLLLWRADAARIENLESAVMIESVQFEPEDILIAASSNLAILGVAVITESIIQSRSTCQPHYSPTSVAQRLVNQAVAHGHHTHVSICAVSCTKSVSLP